MAGDLSRAFGNRRVLEKDSYGRTTREAIDKAIATNHKNRSVFASLLEDADKQLLVLSQMLMEYPPV